jgi:hypothetical protein
MRNFPLFRPKKEALLSAQVAGRVSAAKDRWCYVTKNGKTASAFKKTAGVSMNCDLLLRC